MTKHGLQASNLRIFQLFQQLIQCDFLTQDDMEVYLYIFICTHICIHIFLSFHLNTRPLCIKNENICWQLSTSGLDNAQNPWQLKHKRNLQFTVLVIERSYLSPYLNHITYTTFDYRNVRVYLLGVNWQKAKHLSVIVIQSRHNGISYLP